MKKKSIVLLMTLIAVICLLPAGALAKTLTLEINSAGSASSDTRFTISGDTSGKTYTMQGIFALSNALVADGDTVVLPAGSIYYGSIVDVYHDVTVKGAGEGVTTLYPISDNQYRGFRLYNRYAESVETGDITKFTFKDLTLDGSQNSNAGTIGFLCTSYNIELNVENASIQNFNGPAFAVWGAESLTDGTYPNADDHVGTTIMLTNVDTRNNGRTMHYDQGPYKTDKQNNIDRFGFAYLFYDASSTFNEKNPADDVYKFADGVTYTFNSNNASDMNNARINDMYVSYGDVTPVNPPAVSAGTLPKTGDASRPALYMALLAMSACALTFRARKAKAR